MLSKTLTLVQALETCSQLLVCHRRQVRNRFSSLGTTVGQISPNYQSALVSSYDPFQISTQITQLPSPLRKSSPYAPKDKTHLFIIESVLDNLSEPVAIAKHYFPPNFHFMPQSPYKSLKYYRDILNETQSVEIKPVKDCNQPHIILYHSLYIHQILSQ